MDKKDLYDKQFLWDTLYIINEQVKELSKWSVYNNDVNLDEIAELKAKQEALQKKFTEQDKQGLLEEEN